LYFALPVPAGPAARFTVDKLLLRDLPDAERDGRMSGMHTLFIPASFCPDIADEDLERAGMNPEDFPDSFPWEIPS
jgi:hypothetical protein